MHYLLAALILLWGISSISYAVNEDLKELQSDNVHDWQLVHNDQRHNIKTYWKNEDDRPLRSVKGEAFYDESFDTVAKHQLDPENYKNWFMEMEESHLLKKISDTEFYYYFTLHSPIHVVPSRDAIIHVQIAPYSTSKETLTIRYSAAPDWQPSKTGFIRIPIYDVTTVIIPISAHKTKAVTIGYVDVGGSAPNWLVNYLQQQIPYYNLLGRARDITHYEPKEILFKYRE